MFKSHLDLIIIHSNVKIGLTIVFISRWKRETNSDHSSVDSNSLTIIHLDMVGVMYTQEHLQYGQIYYYLTTYDYF